MTRYFKVPVAWDDTENIVLPETAFKGTDYFCPECKGVVHLRSGDVTRPHFYHLENSDCGGEGALHMAAKMLLVEIINKKEKKVTFEYACSRCRARFIQPLSNKGLIAVPEYASANRRLDIALIDESGTVIAGIEIRSAHAVDREKANDLEALPWVEVAAQNVIANAGVQLPVLAQGKSWKMRNINGCPECQGKPVDVRVNDGHVQCPRFPLYIFYWDCLNCQFTKGIYSWSKNPRFWLSSSTAIAKCLWSKNDDNQVARSEWARKNIDRYVGKFRNPSANFTKRELRAMDLFLRGSEFEEADRLPSRRQFAFSPRHVFSEDFLGPYK